MKQETIDRLNGLTNELIGDDGAPQQGLSSLNALLVCEFSQSICGNAGVILIDGQPMTLGEIVATLKDCQRRMILFVEGKKRLEDSETPFYEGMKNINEAAN